MTNNNNNRYVYLKRTAIFNVIESPVNTNTDNEESEEVSVFVQEEIMKRKRSQDLFELLPDSLLVEVAEWLLEDASDVVRFVRVNQRTRKLLGQDAIVQDLLARAPQPEIPDHTLIGATITFSSLEQVAFYQAVERDLDLLMENRIGFDYASLEMDDDDHHSGVKNSRTRVETLRRFLRANHFPDMTVVVQAHCGTGAPAGVAPRFSAARGHYVATCLAHDYIEGEEEEFVVHYQEDDTGRIVVQFGGGQGTTNDNNDQDEGTSDDEDELENAAADNNVTVSAEALRDRIEVNAWGRRVAFAARASLHPYSELAKEGKGWVELYVKLGDMELPPRPDFYGTMQLHSLNT
jgi:hypothetical protein